MKRILLTLILSVVFVTGVNAQLMKNYKNEISLGYGFATTDEFLNTFNDVTVSFFGQPGQTLTQTDESYWGAPFITFRHNLSGKSTLGVTFAVDFESGSYANDAGVILGSYTMNTYTIAAEGSYNYVTSGTTIVYGLLGAGYSMGSPENTFTNNSNVTVISDSYDHFNFQVTPIGVKYGGIAGGFFELGFGYKGVVNGGFYFKFK